MSTKELIIHCCVHYRCHIDEVSLYCKQVRNVAFIGFHRKMKKRVYILQNTTSNFIKISCIGQFFLYISLLALAPPFFLDHIFPPKTVFPIFSIILGLLALSQNFLCPEQNKNPTTNWTHIFYKANEQPAAWLWDIHPLPQAVYQISHPHFPSSVEKKKKKSRHGMRETLKGLHC